MNNASSNTSLQPLPPQVDKYHTTLASTIYFSLLVFLILVFNGLVITAFCTRPKLRTKQNIFLISLSVADLSIGVFVIPVYAVYLWNGVSLAWINFYFFTDVTLGVAAIFSLTAITLERCYAILRPMEHRVKRHRGAIISGLCVTWCGAFLAGALHTFQKEVWFKNFLLFTMVFYCIPLLIIITSYTVMFKAVRKHIKRRGKAKGLRRFKQDTKAAVTVATVTGFFLICWIPLFMATMLVAYCDYSWCHFVYDVRVVAVTKCLQYTHSVTDPFTYGIRNQEFRRSFKFILSRLFCRNSADTEGSTFPDLSNFSFTFSRRSRIYVIPRRNSSGSSYINRESKCAGQTCNGHIQPEALSMRHVESPPPSPRKIYGIRQTCL